MSQAILNYMPSQLLAFFSKKNQAKPVCNTQRDLTQACINQQYTIKDVVTNEKEITNFLFTLGCFKGESITVISVLSETFVISVKDARYSIDAELAKTVILV